MVLFYYARIGSVNSRRCFRGFAYQFEVAFTVGATDTGSLRACLLGGGPVNPRRPRAVYVALLSLALELPLSVPIARAQSQGTLLLAQAQAQAQRVTGPVLPRASAVPFAPRPVRQVQSHGVPQPPDPSTIRAVVTTSVHRASGLPVAGPRMLSPHEIDGPISAARVRVRALRSGAVPSPPSTLHHITRPGGARQPNSLRVAASVGGSGYGAGTGINPWWRYTEQNVPGGGHVMANVGTGNVVLDEDDMAVPHKGIAFAYRRTYNMQSGHDVSGSDGSWPTLQGNGWTTTWDAHLSGDPAHGITVWDIDGGRYDYTLAGDGVTWLAPPGQHATLTSDGGCGVLWAKKSGTTYYFYALNGTATCTNSVALYGGYGGRLNSIIGRNRNISLRMVYNWDNGDASVTGKIANITALAESGLQATLVMSDFNGHRLASGLNRPDGTVIYYSYDGNGNLTRVSSPPNNTSTTNIWHSFGYGNSSNGAPYMVWAASPRWVGSGANEGSYVYFGVQPAGTGVLLNSIGHVGWVNPTINDAVSSGLLQPSQPTGVVQFLFETYNSGTLGMASSPSISDTDGHMTTWTVDAAGRPTQTRQCTLSQGQQCTGSWLVSSEAWDTGNNLTAAVDPRGYAPGASPQTYETDYAYDANGNTVAIAAPNTATSQGSFRPTKLYDYDGSNNVTAYCDETEVHSSGADWSGSYGGSDTLCSSRVSMPHWRATYNYPTTEPYGELATMVTPSGYTRRFAYDAALQGGTDYGLPTSVTGDGFNQLDGKPVAPAQTYWYDGSGSLRCYNKGSGTYVLSYDAMNRLTSVADPDDSSANQSSICGKASGLPAWNTQAAYTYNADGTKSSEQSPSERAYGVATLYTYDLDGNTVSETVHHGCVAGQTCPSGTTQKWYDGADRLVEVQQPHDERSFPNANLGSYDGDRWLTRYLYDLSNGGVVSVTGSASFASYGNLYKTQSYLRNDQGVSAWTDVRGSVFDAMDREVRKFTYSVGTHALETSTLQYDLGSDSVGKLSKRTNATGEQTTYAYNERGAVSGVAYSADSGLTPAMTYSYDANARPALITSSQFGTEQRTYDSDGRLRTVTEPGNGGLTDPGTLTYSYYGNGWKSALDVASPNFTQPAAIAYSYRADGSLRTQSAQAFQSGTWSKVYTDAGRLLTISGIQNQSRSYDTSGQLATYTLGGSTLTYSHDPEGSVESLTVPNANVPGVGNQTETLTNVVNVRGELIDASYAPNSSYAFPHHHAWTGAGYVNYDVVQDLVDPAAPPPNTTYTADILNGVLQERSSYSSVVDDYGVEHPVGSGTQYTFDVGGRLNKSVSRKSTYSTVTAVSGSQHTESNDKVTTETTVFDAENHTSSQHQAIVNVHNGTTTTTDNGVMTIGWGPNGHPVQVVRYGYGLGAYTAPNYASMTLHWDGDALLFVTDANGSVIDFKVGTDAETSPSNSHGMTVYDRDTADSLLMTSNSTGHSGITPLDPNDVNGPSLSASSGYLDDGVGVGIFDTKRGDGYGIGSLRINGVRAFSTGLGSWTTPDAYEGEVHDPASQQRYMWNRGNAYDYSDPSGYSACAGVVCLLPPGAIPGVVAAGATMVRGALAVGTRAIPGIGTLVTVLTPTALADDTVVGYNKAHPPATHNSPQEGEPDSDAVFPDGKGGSTVRHYGSDGGAETDHDYGHNHNGDPHEHTWQNGKRSKNPTPLTNSCPRCARALGSA